VVVGFDILQSHCVFGLTHLRRHYLDLKPALFDHELDHEIVEPFFIQAMCCHGHNVLEFIVLNKIY
jgi:hypothetical protein